MSGLHETDIRSDARFLEDLARDEFSLDVVSGDRPFKQLDDLLYLLVRKEKNPGILAYLAHAFTACYGERLVSDIGGRWGETAEDGLQIEYIGGRRSLKLMKLCSARMLRMGATLPVSAESDAALRLFADAYPDDVQSFETLYDALKREHDAGGWRLTDAGWTIISTPERIAHG